MGHREVRNRSPREVARRPGKPGALLLCAAVLLAGCSSDGGAQQGAAPTTQAGAESSGAGSSGAGSSGAGSSGGAVVAHSVVATAETEPVPHAGDSADDPAVWVNPDDPSMSAVIGTDKHGGLAVYDLAGRQLQYLAVGDMNNVDVRPAASSLTLAGRPVVLVVAGNRSSNTLGVFELDPRTRQLSDVAADAIRPNLEVYGSCLYHSARTGKLYEFVNSKKGEVEQWELTDDGSGRVAGTRVRSFAVSSQTEGCVADDELGDLYLGEETVGIWKFGAEPDAGDTGTLIAKVSSSGPLVKQVEGLTLAYGNDGTGYLFASSQGDSSYAVFRREGDNAYLGTFKITSGPESQGGIDGTQQTDGIDVTTAALGTSFPSGVFVSQDGENGTAGQNFKLVPLQEILPG